MLAPTSSPNAGSRLRAEREALRLSSRDVERLSSRNRSGAPRHALLPFPLVGHRH